MSDADVKTLAGEAGVLVDWEDAAGAPQTVSTGALRSILAAMDLPAGNARDAAESRARLRERRSEAARAFRTADVGKPFTVEDANGATARLTLEDGEVRDLRSRDGAFVIDTPGYHRLTLGDREMTIAAAPPRCFTVEDAAPGRRLWGAAVQLYALRGTTPSPFGDFGALAGFASTAAARGADAVAISPVHALFAADARRYSPYAPSTRLFLNAAYADPSVVFGEPLRLDAPARDLVDWAAATPAKLAALRALFEDFRGRRDDPRHRDFAAFRQAGGEDLEAHARFEALHGRFFAESGAAGWQAWPEPFRDAGSPAVAAFAREQAVEVEFHVFLQWLADRSLAAAQRAAKSAGMALGLITDVAVGMDAGGSHAWSRPRDLLNGLSVGAPPDVIQPAGQDWGLAAFSPDALARSGYQAFIATLRAAMRHAGGVRIDHVMALRRLWLIPHGADSSEGAYVLYPQTDMLRLVALESRRARAVVVGEDLGTVPPGFRETLDDRAVMGMRVLSFERTTSGGFTPPHAWSADAVAMTSTHDLPTVAGWWRGRDIDWIVELGGKGSHATEAEAREAREKDRDALWRACVAAGCAEGPPPPAGSPAPAVDAATAFVASAASKLAIFPVEDLLGIEEQPNIPGTIDEHPNWRRRLAADVGTLFDDPEVAARLQRIGARRR